MFGLDAGLTVALLIALFFVFVVFKGIQVVSQQECMIVERLGRFNRVCHSGVNIVIPFLEQPKYLRWVKNNVVVPVTTVDLREVLLDIPEQRVITKDNVGIAVDAIIYLQVVDVSRAAYEVQDVPSAVGQLTITTLRSTVGDMELDQTLSSRDIINTRLKTVLDEATDKWGVKVNRVEIKNIIPSAEIQLAMEKQMQAERERRAQVLQAEGFKQAKILEAEGDKRFRIERSEGEKQERINQAQGDREAMIARAEGQAQAIIAVASAQTAAIEKIRSAAGDANATLNYLIAMEYLKRFGEFTTKNTDKVFVPYEASATLSSLGSIRDILTGSGSPK